MNELQSYINALEEYYVSRVIIYVTYKSYKFIKKIFPNQFGIGLLSFQ